MTSLAAILKDHSDVLTLLPSNRIKCEITGHEMPTNVATIIAHLNGKKFKKIRTS